MPQQYIVRGQRVTPEKIAQAKEMRSNMTEAEKILWQSVRANRLNGWHFRRQQIIAGYIVDFYCHQATLIIEVDGEIHLRQVEADKQRDLALTQFGFCVIRFLNQEILEELPTVLGKIQKTLQIINTSPYSPPFAGEGPGERSKE